jgi:23S rRNA pseudouridine955/2504/2580 synthase
VRIDEAHDGQRIDNFLLGQLKGVPKSLVYRILRTGQVGSTASGPNPTCGLPMATRCAFPRAYGRARGPRRAGAGQLERIAKAIIHEDRDFLVIDKPSGVASHGGSGISFGAIELLRAARPSDTSNWPTAGPGYQRRARPHAPPVGADGLADADPRQPDDQAIPDPAAGKFRRATFDVNVPLRKSVLQGGERMVRVDDDGKAALTRFRSIDAFRDATLAEATLFTGRTHQIRVHSAHSGHPIAGDEKYGDREFNLRMRDSGLRRLFLHAARFEFAIGEKTYSFSAPLADELRAVLNALPRTTGARATGKNAR